MYEATFRPIISVIRVTPDRSCVEVALELDGRLGTGFGDLPGEGAAVDPASALVMAAAEGACAAVGKLLPPGCVIELEWARRFELPDRELSLINSAVRFRASDTAQDEILVGAALVHHDPCVAAVRATLDGLTRRVAPVVLAGVRYDVAQATAQL